MASVSVSIPSDNVFFGAHFVTADVTPVLLLGTALSEISGQTIYLGSLSIGHTSGFLPGQFILELAPDLTTNPGAAGPLFSSQMVTFGTITLTASDNSTVTITGILHAIEPYNFEPINSSEVAAFADTWGGLSDRSLTVIFNDNAADLTPTAPSISNRTATVGTFFSTTLPVGTGGDLPLSYTASPLPSGLSFNTTTRVISGTPNSAGSTTVTYRVTDNDGDFDTETFMFVVAAADLTPTAPSVNNKFATVGISTSITLPVGTGGDLPLSYTASPLPSGLSFNTTTRVISGTPNSAGSTTVTYRVTDNDGDFDTETFMFVVAAADLTPTAPSVNNKFATVGISTSITLPVGTGGDLPLSYTASPLPSGLSFNTTTRVISGTPNSAGSTTVTYRVTDNDGDFDTETFMFVVAAAPPSVVGDLVVIDLPGSVYSDSFGPRTWFFSPGSLIPMGSVLAESGNLFLRAFLINIDGSLVLHLGSSQASTAGDTGEDFSSQMEATGILLVEASDGATVTISFGDDDTEPYAWTPSNASEVAVFGDHVTDLSNRTLTITFFDNDTSVSTVISAQELSFGLAISRPTITSVGAVALSAQGLNLDFDISRPTVSIVLSVDLMPTAPSVNNKFATVGISTSITLPVGTGGDLPLSYTASPLPSGLSFNTTTRVISGTPNSAGSTTVTYRVTDNDGDFDTETFMFVVAAAPPSVVGDLVVIDLPGSVYSDSFGPRTWFFSPGSLIPMGSVLAESGNLFLRAFLINIDGSLVLHLGSSQASTAGDTGEDFSSQMEATGILLVEASDGATVTISFGDDDTEPYAWTPSNASEVAVFGDHVTDLSNRTLTITFFDNDTSVSTVISAQELSFGLVITSPTVSSTPAILRAGIGFVTQGMYMTPDRLNQLLVQYGNISERPAGSYDNEGVVWAATDIKAVSQVQDGSWVDIVLTDPAANVPGLRTLGGGAQQGSPGDHNHGFTVTEIDGTLGTGYVSIGSQVSNWQGGTTNTLVTWPSFDYEANSIDAVYMKAPVRKRRVIDVDFTLGFYRNGVLLHSITPSFADGFIEGYYVDRPQFSTDQSLVYSIRTTGGASNQTNEVARLRTNTLIRVHFSTT